MQKNPEPRVLGAGRTQQRASLGGTLSASCGFARGSARLESPAVLTLEQACDRPFLVEELLGAPQFVSFQVLEVFFLQVLRELPLGRELGSSEEIGSRILLFPPFTSCLPFLLPLFL